MCCAALCCPAAATAERRVCNACRFFEDACKRITTIYLANRVQLLWRTNPLSRHQDNTIPDFVLLSFGEEVMVGEGKVGFLCGSGVCVRVCVQSR